MSDPAASLASMTTPGSASGAGVRACARRAPAPCAFVSADVITGQEAAAYEQALATAPDERPMQHFLEAVPRLLVQHLSASDGYRIIPQKQLGAEHVTDFLVAEPGSTGLTWYAVELKRPQAKIFTAKGVRFAGLLAGSLEPSRRRVPPYAVGLRAADSRRRPGAAGGNQARLAGSSRGLTESIVRRRVLVRTASAGRLVSPGVLRAWSALQPLF